MNAVPMSARVRCKNKACRQKVPLTAEHVRQLGGKLRAEVVCPACGERFSPSLVRTVKTKVEEPAEETPPVPIPVPVGAKRAVPPFRPLPAAPSSASAPPPIAWQPDPSPAADPMPFSPLQANAGDRGPGGGLGGWWKRLSKKTQYLILGGGIAVMAVFAFAVQTLGKPPAEEPPPVTPATQTGPTTPSTPPATTKREKVPPLRPPPPPMIDEPSPDELKLIDPTTQRR